MKPLAGIRVIDVTTNISGPTLTMILADLGADVTKIEKRHGDEARQMAPKIRDDGVYFLNINRQKQSITLDLKNDNDKEIFYQLIDEADVFVENYRFGVATKLGVDYATLKARQPKLIYCSLTAYGQHGPKKMQPGYDALMQAETGIMSITGSGDLARVPVSLIDQGSAMWGAVGVVSALLQRHITNEGCHVSTSLYETGVFWSNYHLLCTKETGENPTLLGSNHGAFAPYGAFSTKDGAVMIGISNDSLFEKLCHALHQQAWISRPQYATNEQRVAHRQQLNADIEQLTRQIESGQLIAQLAANGVPVAQVKTMQDVLTDPQQVANRLVVNVKHPHYGDVYVTRLPLTFSNCDITPYRPAPMLGEHNDIVKGGLINDT